MGLKYTVYQFSKAEPESHIATYLGLSEFASVQQDNKSLVSDSKLKFPFAILLVPTTTAKETSCDNTYHGWDLISLNADKQRHYAPLLAQLTRIPSGTKLFKVYAVDEPDDMPEEIGELVMDSKFTS